jgi:hypothetical protein
MTKKKERKKFLFILKLYNFTLGLEVLVWLSGGLLP